MGFPGVSMGPPWGAVKPAADATDAEAGTGHADTGAAGSGIG
jgi:hypothetical protein